jgi:flagellar basal-body rod protein FlgF
LIQLKPGAFSTWPQSITIGGAPTAFPGASDAPRVPINPCWSKSPLTPRLTSTQLDLALIRTGSFLVMGETTLIHLSRLISLQHKLDVTAQNVANLDTAGFRARELSFHEYLKPEKGLNEAGQRERPLSLSDPRFQFTDNSQGAIELTGNPLDVAINGQGYFVVQTEQGERYTRNGSFTIDGGGRLVTLEGQPILGQNGPLQFPLNQGEFAISPTGILSTKQGTVGQLRVVSFERPQFLQSIGGTLFSSGDSPFEIRPQAITLTSGALEKSNVKSTREMSRLAEITRTYEMVGRLLKSSQDADDLNKLANVPE